MHRMALSKVLTEIREMYKDKSDIWCILSTVVMSTLNYPQDIPCAYQLAAGSIDKEGEKKPPEMDLQHDELVMRLCEGIFKSFPLVGYPKVINALQSLHGAVPDTVKARLPRSPLRSEQRWEEIVAQRDRGRLLFNQIYERHADRVFRNMNTAYPDLAQAAIHHLYGPILSDTAVLGTLDTSYVMLASLMAQNLPMQLKGHFYGAQHHGATTEALNKVERTVKALCAHYGVECCSVPHPKV